MDQAALPRYTLLNFLVAIATAIVLVCALNCFFLVRYHPQFEASAEVEMRTFPPLPSGEAATNENKKKTTKVVSLQLEEQLKDAAEIAEQRVTDLETLLKSSEALQQAEDACRMQHLTMYDYSPSEFFERVKVRRYNLTFSVSFSTDDAQVAAVVATSLAHRIERKYGAHDYQLTTTFYEETKSRQESWERKKSDRLKEIDRLNEQIKKENPDYNGAKEVKPEVLDKMAMLAKRIMDNHLQEAILQIRFNTLTQLETKQSQLFDQDELSRLKQRMGDLEKERQTAEAAIDETWQEIAQDDKVFPQQHLANLTYLTAVRVAEQLKNDQKAMEEKQIFVVTKEAETPQKPAVGRPVAAMILLSALGIAIPFVVSFLLVYRREVAEATGFQE